MALIDQLFLYFDKMSMATSLDVRVPFVDGRRISFAFRLPDRTSISWMRRKVILRRVARGIIEPDTISNKKTEFCHHSLVGWLDSHQDSYVREILLGERSRARGQINSVAMTALLEGDAAAHKKGARVVSSAMLLELWRRLYVDSGYLPELAGGG